MEKKRDGRRKAVMTDVEGLVPQNHLVRKIETIRGKDICALRRKTIERVFANLGGVRRWGGGQAFFDKCLSIQLWRGGGMAVSSCLPPMSIEKRRLLKSKAAVSGQDNALLYDDFFLLPSCGRLCL